MNAQLPPPLFREPVPPVLFRYFSQLEHARAFADGEIRLGNLRVYKQQEAGARHDPNEGECEYSYPGVVQQFSWNTVTDEVSDAPPTMGTITPHASDITPTFVCCLSTLDPAVDPVLLEKFGKVVVRLRNPTRFLNSLGEALRARDDAIGPMECGRVIYQGLKSFQHEPTRDQVHGLTHFTKAPEYAQEAEYRVMQRFKRPLLLRQMTTPTIAGVADQHVVVKVPRRSCEADRLYFG